MTRIISWGAAVLATALVVTAASARLRAQGATINKRTFLTFSAPVQVPGATLPAGTYVFRIANPAVQTVWQVFDANERHCSRSSSSCRREIARFRNKIARMASPWCGSTKHRVAWRRR